MEQGLMRVRVSGVCSVLGNLRCRAITSAIVQLDPEGFPSVCVCVILPRISHDVTGHNVKIPKCQCAIVSNSTHLLQSCLHYFTVVRYVRQLSNTRSPSEETPDKKVIKGL